VATRRAAGDGSVHKRKQGGWQGSIDVAVVDGQRRRKTVYGATQREVRDKLTAIRRTLDAGLPSARAGR
jgi:integrase